MASKTHKAWISPFVAVAYMTVSITGILMLLHLRFPGIYSIHQWGGIVFVIAGSLHLTLNWRVFASYFRKKKTAYGMLIGIIVLVFIALTLPGNEHGQGHWGKSGRSQYRTGYIK